MLNLSVIQVTFNPQLRCCFRSVVFCMFCWRKSNKAFVVKQQSVYEIDWNQAVRITCILASHFISDNFWWFVRHFSMFLPFYGTWNTFKIQELNSQQFHTIRVVESKNVSEECYMSIYALLNYLKDLKYSPLKYKWDFVIKARSELYRICASCVSVSNTVYLQHDFPSCD
jgi:hypothetical protein